jgi:glycosyltransferase involved in cell wall biosynthesis
MLPQDELIERMRRWDIFVLSTLGETMSRALMEAQACALPIVATDVSGVSAAIRHGENGLLVPPKDAAALAAALDQLVRDPSLRNRLGARGRAHVVEHYSAERCWNSYEMMMDALFA